MCPVGVLNHCAECGYDDYRPSGGTPAGSGYVVRTKKEHRCDLPGEKNYEIGDQFFCKCGAQYVMNDAQSYQGGPYWKWVSKS